MFRKTLICAGIVAGFTLCFLTVREFSLDVDVLPMLGTLSLVLVASVHDIIPRSRQCQLAGSVQRTVTLRTLAHHG